MLYVQLGGQLVLITIRLKLGFNFITVGKRHCLCFNNISFMTYCPGNFKTVNVFPTLPKSLQPSHPKCTLSSFDLFPCSKNVSLSLNSIEDHMIHSKTTKVCRAKQEHVSVLCFGQSRTDYQKSPCYSHIEEIILI